MANYYPHDDFIKQMRGLSVNPMVGEAVARKAKWLLFLWKIAGGFRARQGGTNTVNWAGGGSANYATTSTWASNAALDKVGSGTDGSASGSHDYKMAMLDAIATVDDYSQLAAVSNPLATSVKLAAGHLERKVHSEIIDGDGTGIKIAGLEYFFSTLLSVDVPTALTPISGSSKTGLLGNFDEALQQQEGDTNIIIMGKPIYRDTKSQMRSAGGITPIHEGLKNFGLGEVLNWDGVPVVFNSAVADDVAYFCYFDHEDGIDVTNVGKGSIFEKGPFPSEDGLYDLKRLYTALQFEYLNARCVARVTNGRTAA